MKTLIALFCLITATAAFGQDTAYPETVKAGEKLVSTLNAVASQADAVLADAQKLNAALEVLKKMPKSPDRDTLLAGLEVGLKSVKERRDILTRGGK
jgi:hypothetical protein